MEFIHVDTCISVLTRRYTQGVDAHLLHVPHNAEIVQGTHVGMMVTDSQLFKLIQMSPKTCLLGLPMNGPNQHHKAPC